MRRLGLGRLRRVGCRAEGYRFLFDLLQGCIVQGPKTLHRILASLGFQALELGM